METNGYIDLSKYYPAEIMIQKVQSSESEIALFLKSCKHSQTCPKCGKEMEKYHATHVRTVQDLPILGKNVTLAINGYDYLCTESGCSQYSFAEDYEGFISRYGRMTSRLEEFIRVLALEVSCEGAAAICKAMGIQTSGDTIIRMLLKLSANAIPKCGDTIGVDDFAYKKGHTYCTVICDEATHAPIEILDGRDGEGLREWLQQNKHIKRVTRDRAGAYAKAITAELPKAMQIADRFHLHKNLLDAIKEALKSEVPNKIQIPVIPESNEQPAQSEESSQERVNEETKAGEKIRE